MFDDVAIGAVIHGRTLTLAVRRGGKILDPNQKPFDDAHAAAAAILDVVRTFRHDPPSVYLLAGADGAVVVSRLRDLTKEAPIVVDLVAVHGKPLTQAGAGHEFVNRWSELLYRLHATRAEGRLFIPEAYHIQLDAFGGEGDKDGKLIFPSPAEVEKALGAFPARAVAAVLASIPALGGGVGKGESEWDPYEAQRA